MGQSVKGLALQAESWVFESQPRQTYVVKTGQRLDNRREYYGSSNMTIINGFPVLQYVWQA